MKAIEKSRKNLCGCSGGDDSGRGKHFRQCDDDAFTVTIPADTAVPFNSLNTNFGSVTLESARLAPNKMVAVAVSSDYTLKNGTDNQEIIPYTVTTFADRTTDVVEVKDNTLYFDKAGDSYDLTINIRQVAWDAAAAGDYSDTVTFNISYVDANA